MELEILGARGDNRRDIVQRVGKNLHGQFKTWLHEQTQLFTQLGVYDSAKVEISRRKIEAIEKKWAANPEKQKSLKSLLDDLLSSELGEILKDFEPHVQSTAHKLGKAVRFKVESGTELSVPPHFHHEVLRTLVHLFNNAVDHGLETPAQRTAVGKPAQGQIVVSYGRVDLEGKNWIQISIEDDGAGINIEKLRAKFLEKGDTSVQQAADLQIAMRIFDSAISTKDSVTELSGQGIGMGAVRAAVAAAGGRIRIARTDAKGTRFEILLPWSAEILNDRTAA
jgi:two-component system chemotaxis sensor kinase CheA